MGRDGRGAPPGRRASRARRCACWPATTGPSCSTRTDGWRPRRSRSSSSRRSASSSSDRGRGRTEMTFQGDPFRTLGIAPSASLNEIRLGLPAAREAVPPRRGRRSRAAAVPGDPGGLRAARRLRGTAATAAGRHGFVVGAAEGAVARGLDAGEGVARGVAGAPCRGVDGGRRPETGRDAGRGGNRGGARAPGRAATARPAGRGRGAAAGAPHAPRLPEGDPGLDDLRRGRRRAARPGVGGRLLVRPVVADVLDDQPARVCRSAQARPRVPGAGPTSRAGRGGRNVGDGRVGRSFDGGRRGDPRHRRGPVTERGRRRGARRGSRRTRLGLERLRVDDHGRRGRRLGNARLGLRRGARRRPAATDLAAVASRRPTTSARRSSRCPTSRRSPAGRRPRTCSRSRAGPAGGGGWPSR